jgi:ABC-type cobalamin/Fe3+-siderophores transport system ATPase subunit
VRAHRGVDGDDVTALDRSTVAQRLGYVPKAESTRLAPTVFETVLAGRKPYATWRSSGGCSTNLD